MKTVQDKDGNIIEVEDDTLCHAGKNGALPVMVDAIVDAALLAKRAEKQADYESLTDSRQLNLIKTQRHPLLKEADIQINKHMDVGHVNLAMWQTYRQDLRDVPQQGNIYNIVWPIKPTTLR